MENLEENYEGGVENNEESIINEGIAVSADSSLEDDGGFEMMEQMVMAQIETGEAGDLDMAELDDFEVAGIGEEDPEIAAQVDSMMAEATPEEISMPGFREFLYLMVLMMVYFMPNAGAQGANHAACHTMLNSNDYLPAAKCYTDVANSINPKYRIHKLRISLNLRKAAYAYRKAAEQLKGKDDDKSRYLMEKAIKLLKFILDKNYCLKKYRCTNIRGKISQYETGVYGGVTVVAKPDHLVSISGYRFGVNKKGSFTQKLRIGKYKIRVSNSEGVSKDFEVNVGSQGQSILDYSNVDLTQKSKPKAPVVEPNSAPGVHPGAVAGYVASSALIAGGTALAIWGALTQQALNAARQDPNSGQNEADYNAQFEGATAGMATGLGMAGVGVAGMVATIIAHLSTQNKAVVPPKAPGKGKGAVLFSSDEEK